MQKIILLASLTLATIVHAEDKPSTLTADTTSTIAPAQAKKTEWLSGLKEPQGMAIYGKEILLADYGAGKVLRYSREGKLLGTLAEGLKSPSQIVVGNKWVRSNRASQQLSLSPIIYVSERKANRIISIGSNGKITPVGQEIIEPLGLVSDGSALFAVAHTTSKILRFDGKNWQPFFVPAEDGRYGYRCLAYDKGTLLLSDEIGEEVLLLTQSGRIASWVEGIADPSGITIGPDGATYITDESDGGRLWRVNNVGEKTVVVEGLGRPRGVLFLDPQTALVSDRNGKVWKIALSK